MAIAAHQKAQFQDRIGRINRGGPNTLGQLYCGVAEEAQPKSKKPKFKGARRSFLKSFLREGFMLPFSILLGGAAVVMARVSLYRFLPEGGALQEKLGAAGEFLAGSFGPLALAFVIALVICGLFRTLKGMRAAATCAGFAAVLFGEGLLVEHYPDIWAKLYSPEYVETYQPTFI